MKDKIIQFISSPFILIVIALITYHRWISFDVFSSGDWWYFTQYAMKEYFPLSIWYSLFGFGNIDITLWRVPVINMPFGLFGNAGFGQEVAEKFTVFWPSLIIGNIAIFLLAKKIFKSNIPSIISSLVFNYNTYYLVSTHFLLYAAGSWAVLSFYFFIETIEKRKITYALLTGLGLFITTAYDLRATYILLMVFALYFGFQMYLSFRNVHKYLFKTIFYTLLPIAVFVALSIYWILPILNASSLASNQVLSRPLFGNEFLNILYAFTLYHPFWTGTYAAIFENQPIALHFWLIPVAALAGLLLNKKNPTILFFGLLAFIGILLTKQVGAPFTDLYKFLFENVPGFGAFREASKFYFLVILGYSILIGSCVLWLKENYTKTKKQKTITNLITVFIALLFLLNTKPYVTGEIKSMYVPREIPSGYQSFNTYLMNQDEYSRTLWFPIFTRWAANNYTHPALSSVELIPLLESYIKKEIDSMDFTTGEIALKLLQKDESNSLLDYYSVQYIVVPPQEEEKQENFFRDYGINRNAYINTLNNNEYLKKVNVDTGALAVYENSNFRPHVYVTDEKISLKDSEDTSWRNVDITFVSPSEYKISVSNVTKPFYLHFSENFHPEWKIKAGDLYWLDVINKDQYFQTDANHFKNEVSFNSFFVDPNEICKSANACQRNNDGSYIIALSLYFRPQAFLYLGGIISIFALVSILGYILLNTLKKGKNGKSN